MIVVSGDNVTLNGMGFSDAFDDVLDFSWSFISPVDIDLRLNMELSAVTTFTAPPVTNDTQLEFALKVTNDQQLDATSSVMVTVIPSDRRLLNDTGYTLCANYKYNSFFDWSDKKNLGSPD